MRSGSDVRAIAEAIIKLLQERGELSSADIARILGIKRHTVTAVLTRLRKGGVVEYIGQCYGGRRCNTKWKLKIN